MFFLLESFICLGGYQYSHLHLWIPLLNGKLHKSQFFNFSFLAKPILGILESQFEIECIFSFVVVLMTLLHYCLQVENVDMMIHSWIAHQLQVSRILWKMEMI
jgi:hypothetical protein